MLRLVVIALILGWVSSVHASEIGKEDVLYLTNGSIVRGTIINRVEGESISIRTREGNVFVYEWNEIFQISIDFKSRFRDPATRKSVGCATVSSCLLPGLGQAYNGHWGKAVGIVGGQLLGSGAVVLGVLAEDGALIVIGSTLNTGIWIYSIIDAMYSAQEINQQSFSVAPAMEKNTIGAKVSIRF